MPHAPRPLSPRKGFFITLEGPEGSGKSSQGRWLVRRLRRAGYAVVGLRDPGSTNLGRALRRILLHRKEDMSALMEALLFIGARVQLVEEHIQPALEQGKIVVCDRFHDSTVAYQGFGAGLDVNWLDALGRRAIRDITPTLTLLLDLPTEQGFKRLRHSHDRMERKTRAFHRSVRQGYLQLAKREPKRFMIINAAQPASQVRAQLEEVVLKYLKCKSFSLVTSH